MADEKDEKRDEVAYEPSTAQRDAEARAESGELEEGAVLDRFVTVNPTYGVEEDGGYIGASPEYRNAADERQKPFNPEDGWTEKLRTAPAEDAGKETLPTVEGLRPGGPSIESGDQVVRTATGTAAPADSATTSTASKATTSTRSTTPPATKSSK